MNEKLHSVLVVGGTRGIGLEFVRQFLELKPVQLIATYRTLENGGGELQKLADRHAALKLLKLDLNDFTSYADFAAQVDQLTGEHGLTLFVHNAGILINDHCGSITQDGLMRALTTNAVAPILLTQHLLPAIRRSASKVTNTKAVYISSCLGSIKRNDGNRPSHRMSKAALNQGVQTFARDLETEKIEFVLLHPGLVKTEMADFEGEISTETSVSGMLKVLFSDEINRNHQMIGWDGEVIEW